MIEKGDIIVLNGALETVLNDETFTTNEVIDIELLSFKVEILKVRIHQKELEGKTIGDLNKNSNRHGVLIRKVLRSNVPLPLLNNILLQSGDIIKIEGRKLAVDRFAQYAGYAERPTVATDLLYVGIGIFLGGILGSLTLKLGNVPISLSSSGGVLIMGIIFGPDGRNEVNGFDAGCIKNDSGCKQTWKCTDR